MIRDGARRLGLVTLAQMTRSLVMPSKIPHPAAESWKCPKSVLLAHYRRAIVTFDGPSRALSSKTASAHQK